MEESSRSKRSEAGESAPTRPTVLWNRNNILVTESEENGVPVRNLWFGPDYRMRQGSWIPSEPKKLNLHYYQNLMGVLFLKPSPRKVLVLGVGCAAVPRAMKEVLGGEVQIDLVDINPEVFQVAHAFFGLDDLSHFSMYAHDGREFVKRIGTRYDAVCVDMWDSTGVPEWLLADEFWNDILGIVEPDAAVCMNGPIHCLEAIESVFGKAFGNRFVNRRHNAMFFGTNSSRIAQIDVKSNADALRGCLARVGVDVDDLVIDWERLG